MSLVGEDSPETLQILSNLGTLARRQKDLKSALEYGRLALAGRERILGPNHCLTAQSLTNVGVVLKDMGDYDASRTALESALVIAKRGCGSGLQVEKAAAMNLMDLHWRRIRGAGTDSAARGAAEDFVALLDGYPECVEQSQPIKAEAAEALDRTGQHEAAAKYLRELVATGYPGPRASQEEVVRFHSLCERNGVPRSESSSTSRNGH